MSVAFFVASAVVFLWPRIRVLLWLRMIVVRRPVLIIRPIVVVVGPVVVVLGIRPVVVVVHRIPVLIHIAVDVHVVVDNGPVRWRRMILRLQRSCRSHIRRMTMVGIEVRRVIVHRRILVLALEGGPIQVLVVLGDAFLGSGIVPDAARSAVVRNMSVVDDRATASPT